MTTFIHYQKKDLIFREDGLSGTWAQRAQDKQGLALWRPAPCWWGHHPSQRLLGVAEAGPGDELTSLLCLQRKETPIQELCLLSPGSKGLCPSSQAEREGPQPRLRLLLTCLMAEKREDRAIDISDTRLHLREPVTHSGYAEEKRAARTSLCGSTVHLNLREPNIAKGLKIPLGAWLQLILNFPLFIFCKYPAKGKSHNKGKTVLVCRSARLCTHARLASAPAFPFFLPASPLSCIQAEGVTSEAVLVGCFSPKEMIQEDTVWSQRWGHGEEKSSPGGWVPSFTFEQGIPGNTSLPPSVSDGATYAYTLSPTAAWGVAFPFQEL